MSNILIGSAAIAAICDQLNADLFGGRLPKLREIKWHDDSDRPDAKATIWVEQRILSLHRDAADAPRSELIATLAHELAHLATRCEVEHHGVRWQRCMRRVGLDPRNGAIVWNGMVDKWLKVRGWR